MFEQLYEYLPSFKLNKKLVVATDCSGIETPIMALDNLGIKYDHIFSSDICKNSKRFIETNFPPKIFYDDIKKRNNNELRNVEIDLYVAGFPCQAFSCLGEGKGFDDERGNIFFYVYDFLKKNRPNIFILENVKNLKTHDKGNTNKTIRSCLDDLDGYQISDEILSTFDYGIPQSRRRIYIVGIKKRLLKKPFEFPEPIGEIWHVKDVTNSESQSIRMTDREKRNLDEAMDKYNINLKDPWIFNLNISGIDWFTMGHRNLCPCILTRCDYYITYLNRKLTPREALLFQGVDANKYDWSSQSNSAIYKFAGNCMSVNVLTYLLASIFEQVKL